MKTLEQASIIELKAYIFDMQNNTQVALQILRAKEQAELANPPVKTPEEETPLPKK
jgi:hypothetical protein